MYKITFSVITLTLLGSLQSVSAFDLGSAMNAVSGSSEKQADSSLLSMLTSQLGITSSQAAGGTAALMNKAKSSMKAKEYKQVTDASPGLKGGSDNAAMGTLSKMAAPSVAEAFKALGMESSMVDQFTPIILDYAEKEGGPAIMNLLKTAF
ncbi:MAG: hypothetical protein DRG24_06435 [Epsilonproteobacteria bacterium]|nr:MAG: hypothetical protein DRG24_06435 [Campylobacterota bacterium]